MSGHDRAAPAPESVPPLTSMPPTAAETREAHRPWLFCAICLHVGGGEAQEADTIINGQAVCLDHAGYVQGGLFTQALALARREQ